MDSLVKSILGEPDYEAIEENYPLWDSGIKKLEYFSISAYFEEQVPTQLKPGRYSDDGLHKSVGLLILFLCFAAVFLIGYIMGVLESA